MLWFSRGLVDPAIKEWQRAESLNPRIPTLDASLGRALLNVKNSPGEAQPCFSAACNPIRPIPPSISDSIKL